MGGKRLSSFRSGDRSEYLASYALSRISFVNAFPRQEDFGIADFLCVLSKQEKHLVYPESAFYVQVKSDSSDIIFDKDAMRWISEYMDQPLFICVANKKTNQIKIYSCMNIWRVVFPKLVAKKVTLTFNSELPLSKPVPIDNDGHFQVFLGPPILDKHIDEIERDPDTCHSLLQEWLDIDAVNIARRRIGRIAIYAVKSWETNKHLSEHGKIRSLYFYTGDYRLSEQEIAPILTALAHCYRHDKQKSKLGALCNYLAEIEEILDTHGKEFAQGKLLVDD